MSKVCFFENESIGFGIVLNSDYTLSRLQEMELVLMSKNTEVVWRWKYSDNSLQATIGQTHYFRGFLSSQQTLGKFGEYWLQVRIVDNILGEKKFDIIDVDIHKAIAIGTTNESSSVVTHEIEVTISTETIVIIGRYNLNILGNDPRIIVQLTNVITGQEIVHNMNCEAVRATFFDANGQQDFNFLNTKKNNNKILCVFPTDDIYTGKVLIEKVY